MTEAIHSPTELRVNGDAISKLYQEHQQGAFVANRRYQRKLVWSVDEKSKLIDSILQDLPIPLILLAESMTEGSTTYEIIDGLQRLDAIFAFIENRFPYEGKYFDLETLGDTKLQLDRGKLEQREPILSREECLSVVNYQIPISTYRAASHEAVDEVFRRINSAGRKLSLQEIRQAGVVSRLARVVRRISSGIRGDATLGEIVPLKEMPKISITNKDLDYGILDQEIFWIKQGILDRDAVRESRDEELVLDLVLDMVLSPIATTGSEYRNSAYGRDVASSATSEANVDSKIQLYGEQELYQDFLRTFQIMRDVVDHSDSTWANWTITQTNPRGIPRYFHAIFLSLYEIRVTEGLVVADLDALTRTLKGFWDRDLTVPGGGVWGANRKRPLVDSIKSQLRPHFKPSTDSKREQEEEASSQFELQLQMSLTEKALFELKQGFMTLSEAPSFDDTAFEKTLRTASAMANDGSGKSGWIFFGVTDDSEDSARVAKIHGVVDEAVGAFGVTGTAHELALLDRSIDEHLRWLVDRIKHSKLNSAFAKDLAASLVPFKYRDRLIWSLQVRPSSTPVDWDNKFFRRIGNSTELVEGQDVVALIAKVSKVAEQ